MDLNKYDGGALPTMVTMLASTGALICVESIDPGVISRKLGKVR